MSKKYLLLIISWLILWSYGLYSVYNNADLGIFIIQNRIGF